MSKHTIEFKFGKKDPSAEGLNVAARFYGIGEHGYIGYGCPCANEREGMVRVLEYFSALLQDKVKSIGTDGEKVRHVEIN